MKRSIVLFMFGLVTLTAFGQRGEEEERGGFRKENLFTGGSGTVAFSTGQTVIGVTPHFGYRITDWLDAGISFNFQYATARDRILWDDKLRQTTIGPGLFTRIYPVRMLYLQAQFEHNFINAKYTSPNGLIEKQKGDVSSFLVGGGFASGRQKGSNSFFYISILLDLLKDANSPYTRVTINPDNPSQSRIEMIPVVRAGFNIALFGGR